MKYLCLYIFLNFALKKKKEKKNFFGFNWPNLSTVNMTERIVKTLLLQFEFL